MAARFGTVSFPITSVTCSTKCRYVTAFQTVVALAEYQAAEEKSTEIEIKTEYMDQVVKMSRRFKDYLSSLPDGNIAKKALRYGKRNDNFN